ncbi:hypothetical protein PS2_018780 [Malus domestica]
MKDNDLSITLALLLLSDQNAKNVQDATRLRNNKSGYESLVEATTVASRKFKPEKQRELVFQAIDTAFLKPVFSLGPRT